MNDKTGIVYHCPSDDGTALNRMLDMAGLPIVLQNHEQILIKPNLVEALPPPITTPAPLVEALLEYLSRDRGGKTFIIGEGTGSLRYDTFHCFEELGYTEVAHRTGARLVDLNTEPLIYLENPDCQRWPSMYLPKILFNSFIISVPVLKAHSMAGVTLTMKNMMGCAPPRYYQGSGGWGKATFHDDIQPAIADLNRYRTPDFTLLDASLGMAQAHLWGPTCDPPPRRWAAAYDPVAIDSYGAELLGRPWQAISHIAIAHQVLGSGAPLHRISVMAS
jgi:uncharacterized protein (DUF362 family)